MQTTAERVINAAKDVVRRKLRTRSPIPFSIADDDGAVAGNIAALIGIAPEYLRGADTIGTILRVQREELPPEMQQMLAQIGLRDHVSPFALDLLAFVEAAIGRERGKLQHVAWIPLPSSDDEWVERIMSMSITEIAHALA
ncbi:MAG: hypothetical protein JWN79_90 [Gemmatimonadetes bacterium]|jgi:hypothetical protein|nr:hypothetical protein [Gemmatimonadota bacterium]